MATFDLESYATVQERIAQFSRHGPAADWDGSAVAAGNMASRAAIDGTSALG